MLQFDAETTRLLNQGYMGADLTRRRQASFDAIAPQPGEHILDIGSGGGFLLAEMARAVGPSGKIIGVDPSADMNAVATQHCADYPQVSLHQSDAHSLPLPDGTIDKAVSVQVFEYLNDIPAALAELARVLRPGGRAVISDTHFGSLIWHSDHPDRMQEMLRSWDRHFTEPNVPELLPSLMPAAGLHIEKVIPHTIVDAVFRPDGLANMMIVLMARYALDSGQMSPEIVQVWRDEQTALAKAGRFFFSVSQFVTVAHKA
jgi:arsenite methyltransferase